MKFVRLPETSRDHMRQLKVPEVAGKTIKSLLVSSDFTEVRNIMVAFTDGTELSIEVWLVPTMLSETKLYTVSSDKTIKSRKDFIGPRPALEYKPYSELYPEKQKKRKRANKDG